VTTLIPPGHRAFRISSAVQLAGVLRTIRRALGLRQLDVAKLAYLDQGTICKYEGGGRIPRLDDALQLLDRLGYDVIIVERDPERRR